MAEAVRQDLQLPLWTLDQAALHFGLTRATVERYVREGLPKYFGAYVKPSEFVDEFVNRRNRQKGSRATPPA